MSDAPAAEQPIEEIDLAAANHIIDKYLTLHGNLMPVLQGSRKNTATCPNRPSLWWLSD